MPCFAMPSRFIFATLHVRHAAAAAAIAAIDTLRDTLRAISCHTRCRLSDHAAIMAFTMRYMLR